MLFHLADILSLLYCTVHISKDRPVVQPFLSNNNNNDRGDIYGAVIMAKPLREFTRGSFDECRLSAGWPPTLRPSQSTWAVSMPEMAATIRIHRHLTS